MFKTIENIDSSELLDFYKKIEPSLKWFEPNHKGKQSGIQFKQGENQFLSATDKARYHDKLSNNLNPIYKDSIIENIIKKFNLFRTRWMWVNPFSCYSIHKDSTPRIHIPLITNQSCLFVFPPNNTFHLTLNQVYHVDTTLSHTFINCSEHPRLHLVGAVLS